MLQISPILERLGTLEQIVIRPGEIDETNKPVSKYPPFIVFRYRGGNDEPFELLREALRGYNGPTEWTITGKGRKYLCLLPVLLREEMRSVDEPIDDAIDRFVKFNAPQIRGLLEDFPRLKEYLDQRICAPHSSC